MGEELEQCPLITPYTTSTGLSPEMLEKLFLLRHWDVEVQGPVPFKWPELLRENIFDLSRQVDSEPLRIREYQKQMIHHLCRMPRFICGDAVGLGKTLDAIAAACWLKQRFADAKLVVCTTKSTTYQWEEEIMRYSRLRPYVMRDEYRGMTSSDARYSQMMQFFEGKKKDALIVKYSSMIGIRETIEGEFDADGYPTAADKKEHLSEEIRTFARIFKEHRENIILVFDECHKFKTMHSSTRNLVFNLSKYAGRVWALTATVIKNGLEEFYNIATGIRIEPVGLIGDFKDEFCIYHEQWMGRGGNKKILDGYKNVPYFKKQMRPFFLGRSQKQVGEPLPELTTLYHPIELDERQTQILTDELPNGTIVLPPSIIKVAGEIYEKERDPDNIMTQLSVQQLVTNHWCLLDKTSSDYHTKKLSPKEEALLDMLDGDYRGEKVIVYAQPLDAKIATPQGWKLMGNLQINDLVSDPDGGIASVEDVYPQGKKAIYRVTTKSGAATECSEDHLWFVQTVHDRERHTGKWSTLPLKTLLTTGLKRGQKYRYHLPIPEPIEFVRQPNLIPPYTVGVLLGDGDIVSGGVTFGVNDAGIADRVGNECIDGIELRKHGKGNGWGLTTTQPHIKDAHGYNAGGNNRYLNALRVMGLYGCYSHQKFIPTTYLQSSIQDRIALLQGLMDTDGGCSKQGQSYFASSSKRLAEDVAELVRSLGGLAFFPKEPSIPKYTHKGIKRSGLPSWRLTIQTNFNPFSLPRKADRWRSLNSWIANPIVSVEFAGYKECQCIRVSSKRSLYLTDDYIPSHNTKYRTWIDRLEWLTKNGHFTERKFLRITGAENEKQRNENKKLFQDPNSGYDLIVINAAGQEGINLQQSAHMICLDLPWSWGDLIQLVGRMVRMASPHSACTLHVMVARGTIDEYTIETLKGKKGVFEKILGESHSAGILDDKDFLDMESGMEQCGTEEEFKELLRAHIKKIGLSTFLLGDLITEAKGNEDYKMSFEKKIKPKRRSRHNEKADKELEKRW